MRRIAARIRNRVPRRALALAGTIELEDSFDLQTCADPIQASTLAIAGDRDRFYPTELLEQTASLIPHARLVLDPGHGHMTVTGLARSAPTTPPSTKQGKSQRTCHEIAALQPR